MQSLWIKSFIVLLIGFGANANPILEQSGGRFASAEMVEAFDQYIMDRDYNEITLTSSVCRSTDLQLATAGCEIVNSKSNSARLVSSHPHLNHEVRQVVSAKTGMVGPVLSWACGFAKLKKGDRVAIRTICR